MSQLIREVEAPLLKVNRAVMDRGLPYGRSINEGKHFGWMGGDELVEKEFIAPQQANEKLIFAERSSLLGKILVAPIELFFERRDVKRKQTVEAQLVPLFLRKSGAFVD
jgi:hypothetical protein